MSNKDFIAQEIQDRFDQQERVLNELAGLNKELVALLRDMVATQRSQEEAIARLAAMLEARPPQQSKA